MDQPSEPIANAGVVETLRVGPFRAYILANLVSMVAKWMQRVAVGWLIWKLSGSEALLGIVGSAELLPAIFVGPIAGALADRIRPLTVVLVSTTIGTLQAVALALAVFLDVTSLPLLFVLILISGLSSSAMEPARAALVMTLVPKRCMATSVALDSLVYNFARFAGPALAGLLLLVLEPAYLFIINAASFLPLLGVMLWLRRKGGGEEEARAASQQQGNIWAAMLDGLLYVFRDPRIAPVVMLLAGMAIFLRPLNDMLPPFVDKLLHGGQSELAFLVAAFGIGSLVAGLAITFVRRRSRLEHWLFAGVALSTLGTLAFVFSEHLALSTLFASIAGGALSIIGISAKTIMQTTCEGRYRGRVMSVYSMLFLGGPAIGLPMVGALAEMIGLQLAFTVGVLANACVLGYVIFRKRLR